MAAQNRDLFLKEVIRHEGGTYTDGVHPYDPGGPTRWGITLTDARLHWKSDATANDVKNMPMSVAIGIYKQKYWATVRGDELPGGVDYSTADYGVNSGVGRARKVLQRVCGVPVDGRLGPDTMAAVAKRDPDAIIDAMNDERMQFLQSLRIWPTYKNGWTTRVREVRATSHTLAHAKVAPQSEDLHEKASLNIPMGKATIPEPKTAKNTVKTAAGGGSAVATTQWYDWFLSHPWETAALAVFLCVAVFGVLHFLHQRHKTKAEAPMPGTKVVPEKGYPL